MTGPAVITPAPTRGASPAVQVVALALTGLSMRTAVTSVGAMLDDVERGLHIGSGGSGVITTLPVLCFAGLGALTPRVAARVGAHRLLVAALLLMTAGVVLRSLCGSVWLFAVCSVLALSGGAASNVLMPGLVKTHFAGRIGAMTAVYTTALAVGQTAAVGLSVPISRITSVRADQWRVGLGAWALFGVVAALPWLTSLRGDRPVGLARLPVGIRALTGSRTAWAMMIFFGTQSLQAYVAFGWFPTYLTDHGISSARAGGLVAFYSALAIPVATIMPLLAARGARRLVVLLVGCLAAAYAGLLAAPAAGVWAWMFLAGVGAGLFPLSLTLMGLRTRTPASTAALSAFSQGLGYLLAGSGPLLTGVLLAATGSWTWPFVLLYCALGLSLLSGLYVGGARTVDGDLDRDLDRC